MLKDHLPSQEDALKVRKEWLIAADERESALRKRNITMFESYNEHTKTLPPLEETDYVAVQNQSGTRPGRWDKTGRIVETLPFRQYRIKMDGSGRVTLRNRKFLRKILPVCSDTHQNMTVNMDKVNKIDHDTGTIIANPLSPQAPSTGGNDVASPNDAIDDVPDRTDVSHSPRDTVEEERVVRRSTRAAAPRKLFNAQHSGKTHFYSSPK